MLPEGAEKDIMNAAEKRGSSWRTRKAERDGRYILRQYRVHMASVMAAGGRAATASGCRRSVGSCSDGRKSSDGYDGCFEISTR